MTLGSMWRRMMRAWPKPAARAASTYGISRIASAEARITSAQRGIIGIMIATIRFGSELPRIATSASARMISGKDRKHVHHALECRGRSGRRNRRWPRRARRPGSRPAWRRRSPPAARCASRRSGARARRGRRRRCRASAAPTAGDSIAAKSTGHRIVGREQAAPAREHQDHEDDDRRRRSAPSGRAPAELHGLGHEATRGPRRSGERTGPIERGADGHVSGTGCADRATRTAMSMKKLTTMKNPATSMTRAWMSV